jgi:threonine/homoserine efflux transporter RhtA
MYNSLNPPPTAPLIEGDAFLTTGSLGTSSAQSMWPVRPYRNIITTTETINMSLEFYNYFIVYSNTPITLSLEIIPIGTMITVEYDGSGSLFVVMDSLPLRTVALTAGTYLIAKFKDYVRSVKLTNPTNM